MIEETEMQRLIAARYPNSYFNKALREELKGVNPRFWNESFTRPRTEWLNRLKQAFNDDFVVQAWIGPRPLEWLKLSNTNALLLDFCPEVHRLVLRNEFCFDFDAEQLNPAQSYEVNALLARRLCTALDEAGVPYNLEYTGNKGIFVYSFLDLNTDLDERTALLYNEIRKMNGKHPIVKSLAIRRFQKYANQLPEVIDEGLMLNTRHVIRCAGSVNPKTGAFRYYIGNKVDCIPATREGLIKIFGQDKLTPADYPVNVPTSKVTQAELQAIIPSDFSLLFSTKQSVLDTYGNAGNGSHLRAIRAFSCAKKPI